jgi:hypothetical protein
VYQLECLRNAHGGGLVTQPPDEQPCVLDHDVDETAERGRVLRRAPG